MTAPQDNRHRKSRKAWFVIAAIVVVVALLFVFLGWLPRHKRQETIDQQATQRSNALPRVQVLKVARAPSASELMIPGTTQAYTEAYIYARASGYVSKRYADIGDHVRAGQLLATIDAPDLDRQVSQARASLRQSESALAQMEAQLHLASLTWQRYRVLVIKGVLSRQDGDTQEANYRVSEANVRAAENTVQANRESLERIIVLQQYEHVTAPFSGVVTQRNIDVGALISAQGTGLAVSSMPAMSGTTQSGAEGNNAGASGTLQSSVSPSTGGTQGGQMFAIASTGRLRVLVSVPEAYTPELHLGQHADLYFQELPKEKFEGVVTRTSASIDQNTRTLLVEVQTQNRSGHLMPGMYAVVNFVQLKGTPPLLIPGEAIVVRDGKSTVALVKDNVVHFQPIEIGRDYGNETEITGGLKAGDVIANTVTDDVRDGVKIDPQYEKGQGSAAQEGGQSNRHAPNSGQYGDEGQVNKSGKNGGGKGGSSGKQGNSGKQTGKQNGSTSKKQ